MRNLLLLFVVFAFIWFSQCFGLSESDIIPTTTTALNSSEIGTDLLDSTLVWVRDSIFALMAVIAIGVFLFIGGKLVIARGNPEEFQKALMMFIYAAIGIFIVAFSWAAVRLVVGINF